MRTFIICLLLTVSSSVVAQSKKQRKVAGYTENDYEITCVGVGVEGAKLIEVYGYGKTPDEAERRAKRNAVHGIIFRGAYGTGGGCQGIKPLARTMTLEEEKADFFEAFFSPGGAYINFVALSSQGGNGREVIKIEKKVYKVGITALVMYDALRDELENAGIIKKLDAGF